MQRRAEMKNCPECKKMMRKVDVSVARARQKVVSYQCTNCDYFEFEKKSAEKVIRELKQKESGWTKSLSDGEEVCVSVHNKKRIILNLQ